MNDGDMTWVLRASEQKGLKDIMTIEIHGTMKLLLSSMQLFESRRLMRKSMGTITQSCTSTFREFGTKSVIVILLIS
jgi:hypothetical protein